MVLYKQKLTVRCCITAFPKMSQAVTGDEGMLVIRYRDTKDKGRGWEGGRVECGVVHVMVNASGLAQKVSIFYSL